MAFVRKRGRAYYLVHNFREQGRVRQVQLASLGRRPRISDDVIEGVASKHPFVQVDWQRLKERSRELVQPLGCDSQYLRDLLCSIREVHVEIADLQLPSLPRTPDRELRWELTSELRLLRGTLDVKLAQFRRGRVSPLRT